MANAVLRKMKYVRLGKSGLKVSRIILGTMSYGSTEWNSWGLGEEEGMKHIKAAYDAGIQTFDTADVYSNGLSEIILGKAIRNYNLPRDEIVVMTKVFSVVNRTYGGRVGLDGTDPCEQGYVNQMGLSRKHIFDGVKHSLERLQLDYIDVLQCHRFDPETPIEETMQALHDVVQAGYVRYIGISSCWAWQLVMMQNYAISNNLTPFISMQNNYSLLYREEEREMMPMLKDFGIGAIPWSPLARGILSRPLDQSSSTKRGQTDKYQAALIGDHTGGADVVKRLEELAKKKEKSMAQIALAWLLHKDPVGAPVVGTTSLQNLQDIVGAIDIELTSEEIKHLEEPYKPLSVIGHK